MYCRGEMQHQAVVLEGEEKEGDHTGRYNLHEQNGEIHYMRSRASLTGKADQRQ